VKRRVRAAPLEAPGIAWGASGCGGGGIRWRFGNVTLVSVWRCQARDCMRVARGLLNMTPVSVWLGAVSGRILGGAGLVNMTLASVFGWMSV
jgi:hypothetical protein